MATITINNTGIIFPDGSEQRISANNFAFGLGGQKWYNYPASVPSPQRLLNTVYGNASARPIVVYIALEDSPNGTLGFIVDGVEICTSTQIDQSGVPGQGQEGPYIMCIVPNGSTYYATTTGPAVNYLRGWRELR
jgi:hypothetical protein